MIPIDYKHWLSLDNWTFEQAAYLFTGIDPNDEAYITLLESHHSWTTSANSNPKPHLHLKQFNKYLQVLKNKNSPESDNKHTNMFKVSRSEILNFAKKSTLNLSPKLLKALDSYSNLANKSSTPLEKKPNPTDEEGHFGQNTVDAFDSLTITGISNLFSGLTKYNFDQWKILASKAKANDLIIARTEVGKGRAGGLFNPVLVANWLVSKKGTSAEKCLRRLKSNLPERSHDNKEDIFGID